MRRTTPVFRYFLKRIFIIDSRDVINSTKIFYSRSNLSFIFFAFSLAENYLKNNANI